MCRRKRKTSCTNHYQFVDGAVKSMLTLIMAVANKIRKKKRVIYLVFVDR